MSAEPRPGARPSRSCATRRAAPRCCSPTGPRRWRSGRGCTCSRAARSTRPTPTPACWSGCGRRSTAIRRASTGAPFVVAAIREAWEEAGILLGTPAGTRGPVDGSWRFPTAAEAGTVPFLDLVVEHDVELRGDWLVPLSRWVTPPVVPRRYDARFFVAWLPDGGAARVRRAGGRRATSGSGPPTRSPRWAPGGSSCGCRRRPRSRRCWRVASVDDLRAPRAGRTRVAASRRRRSPGATAGSIEIRTGGAGGVPGTAGRTWVVGRAIRRRRPGRPVGRGRRRDPRGDRARSAAGRARCS